jgi:hypothetical protein
MSTLTKKQLEDIIAGLNGRLEGMERKIDALESLPRKLAKMEQLLEKVNEENASLRKALEYKEDQVNSLRLQLNSLEQHHRSWSIRVNNLHIPESMESDNRAVKKIVYDSLLLPILNGAVANGTLSSVPSMESTLEYAHILPAKGNSKKPVIAKFFDRGIRDAVFTNKKQFAPRNQSRNTERPGSYIYPFFEDLTKLNFNKMRAIAAHEKVAACWSSRGSLKFKLNDSELYEQSTRLGYLWNKIALCENSAYFSHFEVLTCVQLVHQEQILCRGIGTLDWL